MHKHGSGLLPKWKKLGINYIDLNVLKGLNIESYMYLKNKQMHVVALHPNNAKVNCINVWPLLSFCSVFQLTHICEKQYYKYPVYDLIIHVMCFSVFRFDRDAEYSWMFTLFCCDKSFNSRDLSKKKYLQAISHIVDLFWFKLIELASNFKIDIYSELQLNRVFITTHM